ncbi:MAG: hypothetical protein V4487_00855 [Chlamydiota bacterium]
MRKMVLFLGFLLSVQSLPAMTRGGVQVQVDGGDGYYYDDGYYGGDTVVWYGPGWYWGVYFNNEGDYYGWRRNHARWGRWHNHGRYYGRWRGGYHRGGGRYRGGGHHRH